MNLGQGQAHESHFGPPSEPISIARFLQYVVELESPPHDQPSSSVSSLSSSAVTGPAAEAWTEMSPEEKQKIAAECGVDDLRTRLVDVIQNPRLMAHVTKTHEASVQSIYETADPSRRRKKRRITVVEPAEEHGEVTALRMKMEDAQLNSSILTLSAASFIRPPKHSDHNTLIYTKQFAIGSPDLSEHHALIFVTIYNRLSWGHRLLSRSSQHVVLSSQTLGDLFDVIPCASNELPEEILGDDGAVKQYRMSTLANGVPPGGSTGGAIYIDGLLYGDGFSEEDYSDRILKTLSIDPSKYPKVSKGSAMHETTFRSLTLQLHQPYWLLHAGNCEHFFEVDQIRLFHPEDPPLSQYPLTTQMTPPLLDLCRVCSKVPAVYSILGDVRLGESPFLICGPCWRCFGPPRGPERDSVVVVPLPKHEHGWSA